MFILIGEDRKNIGHIIGKNLKMMCPTFLLFLSKFLAHLFSKGDRSFFTLSTSQCFFSFYII